MKKREEGFVSYVVATPLLNLGGCRLSLARGNKVDIDKERAIVRYEGQEYTSASDIAILLRDRDVPMIVLDTKANCSKFSTIPEKRTKTTKVKMEIIESDEDISRVIDIPCNTEKRDLGKPTVVDKTAKMKVEPQSVVTEIPIKKAKSV